MLHKLGLRLGASLRVLLVQQMLSW